MFWGVRTGGTGLRVKKKGGGGLIDAEINNWKHRGEKGKNKQPRREIKEKVQRNHQSPGTVSKQRRTFPSEKEKGGPSEGRGRNM